MTDRLSFPIHVLLCALAGAASVCAFAPFGWWPLQSLLLALLFHFASRTASIRQTALLGWAYGSGWMLCGIYWLFISMHRYGGMPAWMAALAVFLLAVFLGGFYACLLAGGDWLRRRWRLGDAAALLLMFPTAWALSDWLRGWLLTGFPWLATGYAHTDSPLAGFAPLIGVYGIGLLGAMAAGCLALLTARRVMPAAILAILFGAGAALAPLDWTEPNGKPVSVRLLQGNVPQDLKFDGDTAVATLALYADMIRQAPADLIATPETALPFFLHQLPPDYLPLLAAYARQSNSHLALGIPVSDGPRRYANSMIGIAPAQDAARSYQYRYDKHHLVPFGEFIPFGFRWFVDMMRIPLGDFSRAPVMQPPFRVGDQWVLPNICYEDLFGEEIAAQLAGGGGPERPQASILLNLSNIAWFGDTIAVPQHLQISQMRARETGRPMLRATNTGATAVVDHKGRVQAQLPPFQAGVLATTVQGYRGATPYVRFGNLLFAGLALLALAAARLLVRKTPFPG